jgi:hypothetical protein
MKTDELLDFFNNESEEFIDEIRQLLVAKIKMPLVRDFFDDAVNADYDELDASYFEHEWFGPGADE